MIEITSTGTRYLYCSVRAINPATQETVDLTGATFKMALVPPNDRPDVADWKDASHAGEGLVAGQTYTHVRSLVGSAGNIVPLPGQYEAWVQISLGQEVVEEACGRVRVL